MLSISETEERLKIYKDFLENPPENGSFAENSFERRACRVALRRALEDANRLLTIIKTLPDYSKR